MVEPRTPPGYVAESPLGECSQRARDTAVGASVVVRAVELGLDRIDDLRRGAAVAGSLRSAHLTAVRDVLVRAGQVVIVRDWVEGTALSELLRQRGRLTPGEVVTLVVPLARTLAELHARGVAHGSISVANVVIASDGRPVLTDALVRADEPAADHEALIAVGRVALGATATGSVAAALSRGATGSALAAALLAAAAPEPLRTVTAPQASRVVMAAPGASHRGRTLAIGLAAIALAGAVGVATARPAPAARTLPAVAVKPAAAPATPSPQATPRHNWLAIVAHLERIRAAAFTRGKAHLLRRVYLPRSDALSADAQQLHDVLGSRGRARGLASHVFDVRLMSSVNRTATLMVTDAWTSYDVVLRGRVIRHGAGRGQRTVLMRLRHLIAGWRISSVRPSTSSVARSTGR